MYKQRSPYKNKSSNKYTEHTCIRCGCQYTSYGNDSTAMCQDCKIKDSVDQMTRRIKFQ